MSLPLLSELIELRGLAQPLTLRARRPARAASLGQHVSRQRGRGLELQEVRAYVPGDDPRNIDWRVTARRGRPHTKLFREERERPVWIVADLQPGAFFGTRRQLKSAAIVRAAALLAWIAALGGDRVGGLISSGTECRVLPPRSREAGVLPFLGALESLQPRAPAIPVAQSLSRALALLVPLARPGCLILVLSDFAGLEASIDPAWWTLARVGELRLFRITDALEERTLPDGRYRGGLPGALRVLDGARVRARWRAAWRERESRIAELASCSATPVVRLDTAESVERTLALLLQGRSA
jgi:uncharacterized protein (DUF58 family)